jgi:uncharacterized protein YijF (DUF1287 family)
MISRRSFTVGVMALGLNAALPKVGFADRAAERLIVAARKQLGDDVRYEASYWKIPYPGGDVPVDVGVCTDVIIRAYRAGLGLDLQKLVHEDMRTTFSQYPNLWGLTAPDTSIDHRRVPNLEVFFARQGGNRGAPRGGVPGDTVVTDLRPGDLLTWRLGKTRLPHIGLVTEIRRPSSEGVAILHNIGAGPEEQLLEVMAPYLLVGHYRYAV